MRYLMENYANKGIGFPEDGFLKALRPWQAPIFTNFMKPPFRAIAKSTTTGT